MQYLITAYDGKDMLEKRMEVRSLHLKNMAQVEGRIICAGGILDNEGKMKGSVLVMDFASRELLDQYLQTEPYIAAKVREKVTVEPINVVIVSGEKVGR